MSCERSSARVPVSRPSEVAVSGASRNRPLPMSSSNARASASVVVAGLALEPDGCGAVLHADISGRVAVDASAAMAWRRVKTESGTGSSHWFRPWLCGDLA